MKRDKKINHFAKRLAELSKEDGVVTEARVKEVLAGLRQSAQRNRLALLKAYLSVLRREVARQTALIRTPGALGREAIEAIEASFTKLYGRPVRARVEPDANLIAGVSIRVGDDLYDASVSGRLKRLAEFVN